MTQPANTAPPKRRILFVDDDTPYLQMIDRLMRLWSKNDLDVLSASSASEALSLLQDQNVNLIVLDVCMPVVDGLQFLTILGRRYPGIPKVVLTGYATEAYRTACLANGAELFLEKPRTSEGMDSVFATLDELTRFQPEPGFRGVLRRVGLLDVIQMECLGRTSSVLVVAAPNASGSIYIKDGAIVHAETPSVKGEEALKLLLTLNSGEFQHNPYSEPPEVSITGSWEGLLMDAAQTRDEAGATEAEPAPTLPLPEPPPVTSIPAPATVKVEELMICSEAGDVLHAWQCSNTDLRISLLEFLSQKARLLQNVLPLGTFDRAEFNGEGTRLVAQVGFGRGVVLRSSYGSSSENVSPANNAARPSPELKSRAQQWFEDHLNLAGLLSATLQFSDRTGLTHTRSPKFAADALENLRRCVNDGFQVLRLQKFSASRASWVYDQTAIQTAQWSDGTCVAFVVSRQSLELNRNLIDRHIEDFLDQEALN